MWQLCSRAEQYCQPVNSTDSSSSGKPYYLVTARGLEAGYGAALSNWTCQLSLPSIYHEDFSQYWDSKDLLKYSVKFLRKTSKLISSPSGMRPALLPSEQGLQQALPSARVPFGLTGENSLHSLNSEDSSSAFWFTEHVAVAVVILVDPFKFCQACACLSVNVWSNNNSEDSFFISPVLLNCWLSLTGPPLSLCLSLTFLLDKTKWNDCN